MSAGTSEKGGPEDTSGPGFDESLERLEAIVAELEQGGSGLEESLSKYRDGVALLERCRGRLETFRQQVEELSGDGVKPYGGDPDIQSGGGGRGADPAAGLDTPF